jgi:hypothetical protein
MKNMIFELINDKVEKVDTYYNSGSIWLIFTDRKQWVIELTKDGTLWYNYYFFEKVFNFFSLNVIENQHYITEWVEDTIQNRVRNTRWEARNGQLAVEDTIQNGVKHTLGGVQKDEHVVEDTIQNGVKETDFYTGNLLYDVEDTIQNGVKHTEPGGYLGSIEMKGKIVHQFESPKQNNEVEDTIQNGVKHTRGNENQQGITVEEVIQNGVRNTDWRVIPMTRSVEDTIKNGVKNTVSYKNRPQPTVEGVIQNGIKETKQEPSQRTWKINEVIKETYHDEYHHNARVDGVIRNGIKHTQPHVLEILNPIVFEPTLKENKRMNEVNNVLEKGIKEVIELPDQSGELNGYGEYYARQKNRAYPHTDTVNDVIRDGIKETNWRTVDNFPEFEERVIQNGIKETWGYERQPQQRIDHVIEHGTKNPSL